MIENNKEYFEAIELQYRCKKPNENRTLQHKIKICGLEIVNKPVFINFSVDAHRKADIHTRSNVCTRSYVVPNMKNLQSFERKDGHIINIIQLIGPRYWDFGVLLLNDSYGFYIESIEKELNKNSVDIIRKILIEWFRERDGAKPVSWESLIDTLHDIGLIRLAEELKKTLLF